MTTATKGPTGDGNNWIQDGPRLSYNNNLVFHSGQKGPKCIHRRLDPFWSASTVYASPEILSLSTFDMLSWNYTRKFQTNTTYLEQKKIQIAIVPT